MAEIINVELEQEVELQTSYELSGGIIPTGTINITTNGLHDVSSYAEADVNVQGGITPTGTKEIEVDSAGTTTEDVTNYASVEITVPQGQYKPNIDATPTNPSISVSNGGLITAEVPTQYINDLLKPTFTEGYIESSDVSMKVKIGGSATHQLNTVNGQTVTPTTSTQYIAVQGDYVLGAINVAPIPSQYIIPTGTKQITDNGTGIDVSQYASVDVNVSGGGGISIDDLATNSAPSGAITLGSSVTSIGEYAFAGKPITSIIAPNATSIGQYSLQNTQITTITDTNFPLFGVNSRFMLLLRINTLQSIKLTGTQITLHSGSGALRDMTNLVSVELPNCAKNVGASYAGMGSACFYGDTQLQLVDMGFCNSIGSNAFYNCYEFVTLIMRKSDAIVPLGNVGSFTNTPFRGRNGMVGVAYVPQNLISTYQTASNWSTLYTNGTVSFVKLEGSQYE